MGKKLNELNQESKLRINKNKDRIEFKKRKIRELRTKEKSSLMSYLCNCRKRFHQSDTIWLDHHKHHKSYFSSLEIHVHFPLLYCFHDVDDQERRMMKETMVTERALTVDLVNVGEKEED